MRLSMYIDSLPQVKVSMFEPLHQLPLFGQLRLSCPTFLHVVHLRGPVYLLLLFLSACPNILLHFPFDRMSLGGWTCTSSRMVQPIKFSCSSCLVRVLGWNNKDKESNFSIKVSMPSGDVLAIWKISSNLLCAFDIFLLIDASTELVAFSTNKLPSLSYALSLKIRKNHVTFV